MEALTARHRAVERTLRGHLHRTTQRRFAGTLLCSAPSAATAIAPRPGAEPALYLEPAGFVLHHLRHGGMLTRNVQIGTFPGPFPFA